MNTSYKPVELDKMLSMFSKSNNTIRKNRHNKLNPYKWYDYLDNKKQDDKAGIVK